MFVRLLENECLKVKECNSRFRIYFKMYIYAKSSHRPRPYFLRVSIVFGSGLSKAEMLRSLLSPTGVLVQSLSHFYYNFVCWENCRYLPAAFLLQEYCPGSDLLSIFVLTIFNNNWSFEIPYWFSRINPKVNHWLLLFIRKMLFIW